MAETPPRDVTHLLLDLEHRHADRDRVVERLYEVVYNELHDIATALMRRERADHTLQPTALVHEAYCGWSTRRRELAESRPLLRHRRARHAPDPGRPRAASMPQTSAAAAGGG